MKKYIILSGFLFFIPVVALAGEGLAGVVTTVANLIKILVPVVISAAVFFFFF